MADEPKKDEPIVSDEELRKRVEEAKRQNVEREKEEEEALSAKATEEAQKQMEELKEALARCMADLQNFKRRTEEEKMRFVKFANAELLKELLPIIDNFDRACQQIPSHVKEDAWTKGVVQTHDELMKALEKIGVKKIETVGQKLDPNIHEAVIQGFGKKDEIIEEMEPGYTYHDETLKPAKVKVGDGKKK